MKRISWSLVSLVLLTAVIRCWAWIPHLAEYIQRKPLEEMYKLEYTHAWETFFFQHVTPPLSDIYNAIAYNLLGIEFGYYFIVLSAIVLSALAAGYVFLTCRIFGAGIPLSWGLSFLYSLVMLRIEGPEWFFRDDLTLYFLPIYIYYLVQYYSHGKTSHGIWAGILCGLLIWTSSVPALTALGLFFIVTIFVRLKSVKQRIAIFLIPFTFFVIICAKNYYNVRVFNVASKGGWHNLFFLENINAWQPEELLAYAKKQGAPDWWLWCAENRVDNGYYIKTGACYGKGQGDIYTEGVDYSPLIQKLTEFKQDRLLELVKKDQWDYENRPWVLHAGEAFVVGGRFNAQYGIQGQKVWLRFWLTQPVKALYGIFYNTVPRYLFDGPLYALNNNNGLTITVGSDSLHRTLKLLVLVNALFFWLATAMIFVRLFGLLARWGKCLAEKIRNSKKLWPALAINLQAQDLLCLGFFISFVLTAITTCCADLEAKFWYTGSYLVPVGASVLQQYIDLNFRKIPVE